MLSSARAALLLAASASVVAAAAAAAAAAPPDPAAAGAPGAGGSKPHIVFLFCDNVGWANLGYHRAMPTREVVTPNIDGLASP